VKIYPALANMHGNVLAAVDLETTGTRAGYHDAIQIAIVPLDEELRPMANVRPFYTTIRPTRPSRADSAAMRTNELDLHWLSIHAPELSTVEDMLLEWHEKLALPSTKRLIPLAHNWPFESSFLKQWLGERQMDALFHFHARDAQTLALALNDRACFAGGPPPFSRVGLQPLCKYFKVHNTKPHDALADAIAEAELYRRLLQFGIFTLPEAEPAGTPGTD
jgi:DNA polymerase III epsilon subunit-like protein